MSVFRVGQRVRRVLSGVNDPELHPIPLGTTGTVTGHCALFNRAFVRVDWDIALPMDYSHVFPHTLAPLTDPRADQFIADMKRFARLAEKNPLRVLTPNELNVSGGSQ